MQIEAGKYYRTRGGERVGPMERRGTSSFPWSFEGKTWRDNGIYWFDDEHQYDLLAEVVVPAAVAVAAKFNVGDRVELTGDNEGFGEKGAVGTVSSVDDFDVTDNARIRFDKIFKGSHEWWASAAQPRPVSASTFSIGDRVVCRDYNGYGPCYGTVGSVEDGMVYAIDWTIGDASGGIPVKQLQLTAAPALPVDAPCIVASTDGPSNRPYVHPNRAAAGREAERLARRNPGLRFDVYERVGGRIATVEMREVA